MMPSVSVLTRIIPELYDLIYFVKPKICRLDSGFYIFFFLMGLNN